MIKRIVSVVSIAALLVLSICVPAKAGVYSVNGNDGQQIAQSRDDFDEAELQKFEEENKRLYELGQSVLSQRTGSGQIMALPNFPFYKQNDSQWSDVVMKSANLTIGRSGCCLTSFAMVQKYYGGSDNPEQVNATMGDAACPFQYYRAAELYGYTISTLVMNTTSYSDTVNYVVGALTEGHPVMIGMNTADGSRPHFVVAYGHAYDKIFIKDPIGSADSGIVYLSSYTDNGYHVDNIVVYNN